MPANVVKSVADRAGVPTAEVEKQWEREAKKVTESKSTRSRCIFSRKSQKAIAW
jgi:hypothetical protein